MVPAYVAALTTHSTPAGVRLTWQLPDNVEVLRLLIERQDTGGGGLTIVINGTEPGTVSGEFLDERVAPGREYRYRLRAMVQSGDDRSFWLQSTDQSIRFTPLVGSPLVSRLLGAAPNPFNPATNIRYYLAQPGQGTLCIYDLQGRLVRRYSLEGQATGHHELVWDGTDQSGQIPASGIYQVLLENSVIRDGCRLTLIK